jgi:filamentous hemagglutinin family protein
MTRCTLVLSKFLALASFSVLNLNVPALAQIIPDATLGNENSTVTPGAMVRGGEADLIDGGAIRGSNLFHSFQEFNVGEGQRVYFANPDGIDSILSRITGGNPSNIFGTLGVDGTADLFLLNPNGIVFGESALLDLQGALILSTASHIQLGEDGRFSATNPASDNLIELDPSVFWFNDLIQPGAINITGVNLQMPAGEALSLIGGEVRIDGAQINAQGGRVNIAALAAEGNVQLDALNSSLTVEDTFERSDVSLENGSEIDVQSDGGGNISIYSRSLSLANSSFITAGIAQDSGTINSQAGDIQIDATETVTVANASTIVNGTAGTGDGGNVDVSAGDIKLINGSQISTLGVGQGQVGNVNLTAENKITLSGNSFFLGNRTPSGITSSIALSGIVPGVETLPGEGDSGDIQLQAIEIVLSDTAQIFSSSFLASGDAGDITLTTHRLALNEGSNIVSGTISAIGDAGDITITASDFITLDGVDPQSLTRSGLSSEVGNGSTGDGGDITITTNFLKVTNGARVSASTFSQGNAGDVMIMVDTAVFDGASADGQFRSAVGSEVDLGATGIGGNVEISGNLLEVINGALLSSSTFGSGNAGNVDLDVNRLLVLNGAQIASATFSSSNAGNLAIRAAEAIEIDGGSSADTGLFTQVGGRVGSPAKGDVGTLTLETEQLILRNGGQANATIFGEGTGGQLIVRASDVQLFGTTIIPGRTGIQPSAIQTRIEPGGRGIAPDLIIETDQISIRDGARIAADIEQDGEGQAGNILIRATAAVELTGTRLISLEGIPEFSLPSLITNSINSGATGTAGSLTLEAQRLTVEDGAIIQSSSFGTGNAGDINLTILNQAQLDNGMIATNAEFASGGQIIFQAENLILRGDSDIQTFVNQGQGSGGNIGIRANFVIALEDSDILAFSADGRGGAIDLSQTTFFGQNPNITSENLSREELLALDGNGRVDVNATGGVESGQIFINDSSFIENSLTNLEDTIIDTSTLTAGSCIARTEEDQGSFVVTGRDGLPQRPGDTGIAAYPTGTVRMVAESTANQPIQEPDGVYQLPDGRLVLSRECGDF